MKKYRVNKIFGPTIQGEGKHTGKPVKFLRFSGCNKACSFCDTDFKDFEEMSIENIIDSLDKIESETKIVVVTGGEPLLQFDIDLAKALCQRGYEPHIETNGSIKLNELSKYLFHVSVSPKQNIENTVIEHANDIKFLWPQIVKTDYKAFKAKYSEAQISLQPVDGENYKNNLKSAVEEVAKSSYLRLSIQVHKFIGVE